MTSGKALQWSGHAPRVITGRPGNVANPVDMKEPYLGSPSLSAGCRYRNGKVIAALAGEFVDFQDIYAGAMQHPS